VLLAARYNEVQQEDIDMLVLLFAMALTDAQQAQHDEIERATYERIEGDRAAISDVWQPSRRLLADYTKAQTRYVRLHLYRVPNCDTALAQVEVDLGKVEMPKARHR
jgi:hypothetical protein